MTCIVGIATPEGVYMGGDSAVTQGWELDLITDSKVFINGPLLIGVCGHLRAHQIMEHSFRAPLHDPELTDVVYITRAVVNAVRDCMKSAGYAKRDNEVESQNSQYLIGYRGSLYFLHSDYSVRRTGPIAATGSGREYAMGVLFATEGQRPQERIGTALKAAERFNAAVRAPFTVVFQPKVTDAP